MSLYKSETRQRKIAKLMEGHQDAIHGELRETMYLNQGLSTSEAFRKTMSTNERKIVCKGLLRSFETGFVSLWLRSYVDQYLVFALQRHLGQPEFDREVMETHFFDVFNDFDVFFTPKLPVHLKHRISFPNLVHLALGHFDEELVCRFRQMQDEPQSVQSVIALMDDLCLVSFLSPDVKTKLDWERAIVEGWLELKLSDYDIFDDDRIRSEPAALFDVNDMSYLPIFTEFNEIFWDEHVVDREAFELYLGGAECGLRIAKRWTFEPLFKKHVFLKDHIDMVKHAIHAKIRGDKEEERKWWRTFLQHYPILELKQVHFDFDEMTGCSVRFDEDAFCQRQCEHLMDILD